MGFAGVHHRLRSDRRGSIAIWIAVMMPGLIMATSLAVEVASWAAAQVSVQRAADVSAIAGGINYLQSNNAQTAATFAARIAQLNGASGTTTPTWNSTSNTLTDNQITAQIVSGYQNASDTALLVTVKKNIPATVSSAFSSTGSYTITSTAVAEIITSTAPPSGAGADQPCLLALSTSGQINGTSSEYITMPNCTMRSNGTITFDGGGTVDAQGLYAGGTITIQPGVSVTGTKYPSDGTIADPYANNTALQNALTTAAGLTGVSSISCGGGDPACSGLSNGSTCTATSPVTCTLYPGNYGSLSTTGGGPFTFNLQPGLYLFSGSISLSQTTTMSGTGVTIITNKGISGTGQFTFNVTAPTAAEAASASPNSIPAVVLASNTSTATAFSGSTTFSPTGVVYLPNSKLSFAGSGSSSNPATGSSSTPGCLEIIASSIQLNGYAEFDATSCGTYSATGFTSVSGTTTKTAQMVH